MGAPVGLLTTMPTPGVPLSGLVVPLMPLPPPLPISPFLKARYAPPASQILSTHTTSRKPALPPPRFCCAVSWDGFQSSQSLKFASVAPLSVGVVFCGGRVLLSEDTDGDVLDQGSSDRP